MLEVAFPVVLRGAFLSPPLAGLPTTELQALNQELGRRCSQPPREDLSVCRIHVRLVGSF